MRKRVAVSPMRAAVNLEDKRILPRWIEIGRLLNPSLDLLSVKARVPDLLGIGEIQLRKKLIVDARQLSELFAGHVKKEHVSDICRRRDQHSHLRNIRCCRVTLNLMVAGCQRLDFAGSRVDFLKISRSVFCNVHIDPTVVFTPNRPAWAASSRCTLVSS